LFCSQSLTTDLFRLALVVVRGLSFSSPHPNGNESTGHNRTRPAPQFFLSSRNRNQDGSSRSSVDAAARCCNGSADDAFINISSLSSPLFCSAPKESQSPLQRSGISSSCFCREKERGGRQPGARIRKTIREFANSSSSSSSFVSPSFSSSSTLFPSLQNARSSRSSSSGKTSPSPRAHPRWQRC